MTSIQSSTAGYAAGLSTAATEATDVPLPVTGELPPWLEGDLVRNGPGRFEAGDHAFRHWFDGQAMLHRFAFAAGEVRYTSRYLDTPGERAAKEGRIEYGEFATDPCRSIFARYFTRFQRTPGASGNAGVNVVPMAGGPVAVTEVPIAVRFEPETLATLGIEGYQDPIDGQVTTAHPHQAPGSGDLVNYVLKFGRRSEYQVYRQHPASMVRELIATVPATEPGYLHSFGITEDYVVLAIFPFVVNPLRLLLSGRPFIENYRWRPELGTKFVVLRLSDGSVRGTYQAEPFFAFHHINAYVDGDDLVVDVSAYSDASVIGALYLDRLRAGGQVPKATPTRYRMNLDGDTAHSEPLSDQVLELPRIAYGKHNGRPYRYAYGTGWPEAAQGRDFLNQLVKLDVRERETLTWHEPGCYPGEPVFVAAPGGTCEDDGLVLSVVLCADTNTSFLLVLDARTFREVARAGVPHVVPFGFHGQFTRR